MAFRREVNDRPRLMLGEQLAHKLCVADVAMRQFVARVGIQSGKISRIPGVRQQI